MGHNDKRAGEVVYEILRRFGAGAVPVRFGSSGENIETGECLQQPTWTSERYGLLNFKDFQKFYF